jgi:hypothetical protein
VTRRRQRTDTELELLVRVAELEARVRVLEKRLELARDVAKAEAAKQARPKGRPRPRCPGCTLELPPGRRGVSCVWCGFRFDAVPPWPPKQQSQKRL